MSSAAAQVLLDAAASPFADPVVRLDPEVPPPPDVHEIHGPVRAALHAAISAVAGARRAAMVLVAGDPGMGKTHQLAHLRLRADGAYHCVDIPPLKDAHAPFAHVLRYTVQGLAVSDALERLLWDALRRVAVAVRADADDQGDDAVVNRLDAVLVGGNQFVGAFRALAQQDPELGALLYKLGRRHAPLHGLDADFGRVLGRLTDRAAEAAIIDWLRGAELATDDLEVLGIGRGVDGEDRAFEVLRALAQVASKPIVLCLDQLESTASLLGADGLARMFTAVMEIYQQTPVAIVLMCQSQQWSELRRDVPMAALDRVTVLPPLAKPTADEARRLIESRLAPVWMAADVAPPYPSWPFSPAWIAETTRRSRPTLRQLLLECGSRLDELRRRGAIAEVVAPVGDTSGPIAAALADTEATPVAIGEPANGNAEAVIGVAATDAPIVVASGSGPAVVAAPRDHWLAALRIARDKYARSAAERKDLAAPSFRQDRLREAILDVLHGANRLGRRIGGIAITGVTRPARPRTGPRPPAVISLDGPTGTQRLALDVHCDEPRSAYRVLERLCATVDDGAADVAVMIREAEVPLGDSAKKSLELARTLASRGGGVVYVGRDAAVRLVGAELLLDAAGAAEVLVGDIQASRDEALAFLLEDDDLGAALLPVVLRIASTPPAHRA